MKKKMIIFVCICLSVVVFTGLMASANRKTGDAKKTAEPVEEEFYYNNEDRNMFTDDELDMGVGKSLSAEIGNTQDTLMYYDDVPDTRAVSCNIGGEDTIGYEGTRTFNNLRSAGEEESYGVYDQYSDDKNGTYYYLHSNDKLCLFMKDYAYADPEEETEGRAYTDDKIKDTADTYVGGALGVEDGKYQYQKVEYQEQKRIYLVTYIRRIGDYITDDSLTVFLDEKGEVYAFSAMNRDRYDSFGVEDIDQESLNHALAAVESGQYELDDIRISMDSETQRLIAVLPQ